MRLARSLALGLASIALVCACATNEVIPTEPTTAAPPAASAAGASGSSAAALPASPAPGSSPPGSSVAGRSIASTFALAGPPDCPDSSSCLAGLQALYGLAFGTFVPIDPAGSQTVDALRNGSVQAAILRGTNPLIAADGLVVLADDRHLQPPENVAPVIRSLALRAHPGLAALLDRVSTRLTQDGLDALVRQVVTERSAPADVARTWLEQTGFVPTGGANEGTIVVGQPDSAEEQIVAELYATELGANGYAVSRRPVAGGRGALVKALEAGLIDLYPDEIGSLAELAGGGAGRPSADPAAIAALVRRLLAVRGMTVLAYAPAAVPQVLVVTSATARRLRLGSIGDLAKPAP